LDCGSRKCVNFSYRLSLLSLLLAPQAQRKPNPGAGEAHIPARLLVKDIIPDEAYIGARGQFREAAPLGARVVENLRQVASPDKEKV
jgi:hypothetical protein